MSFGLARGRTLDPGEIGRSTGDLPPLPDDPAALAGARTDPRAWFDDPDRPFEIEIGSGKGGFLIEAASARPGVNLLGIEWAKEFWLYTADRCRRRGLQNVRVLHADAVEFLKWRLPDALVDVFHIYYSDPWPKKKHHKRRVVRDEFLAEAHRALAPGGQLRIVTDHDEYWDWIIEHLERWCDPARAGARFDRMNDAEAREVIRCGVVAIGKTGETPIPPRAAQREAVLIGTNYERKFTHEGNPPHAAVLVKPVHR